MKFYDTKFSEKEQFAPLKPLERLLNVTQIPFLSSTTFLKKETCEDFPPLMEKTVFALSAFEK